MIVIIINEAPHDIPTLEGNDQTREINLYGNQISLNRAGKSSTTEHNQACSKGKSRDRSRSMLLDNSRNGRGQSVEVPDKETTRTAEVHDYGVARQSLDALRRDLSIRRPRGRSERKSRGRTRCRSRGGSRERSRERFRGKSREKSRSMLIDNSRNGSGQPVAVLGKGTTRTAKDHDFGVTRQSLDALRGELSMSRSRERSERKSRDRSRGKSRGRSRERSRDPSRVKSRGMSTDKCKTNEEQQLEDPGREAIGTVEGAGPGVAETRDSRIFRRRFRNKSCNR